MRLFPSQIAAISLSLAIAIAVMVHRPPAASAHGRQAKTSTTTTTTTTYQWRSWGGDVFNSHSSPNETTISPRNAQKLHIKWAFTTLGDVTATPTLIGNALYVTDWGGGVHRLNAISGKPVWSRTMAGYTGDSQSFSRNSPAIAKDRVILGDQHSGTLLAVSQLNGDLIWKRVLDPNPAARITNSPVVSNGVAYVGTSSREETLAAFNSSYVLSFRGSVQAVDVATGQVLWTTYTVPEGYTGGAIWGSNFVVDGARGSLYVTTGNNYSVPADVSNCLMNAASESQQLACLDPADYIDSVLALDLKTGRVKWSRQLGGADTWTVSCVITGGVPCPVPSGPDYDFGAAPNLIQLSSKQILGVGQKSGMFWGLNPANGAVLYGSQVGPGGNYGGIQWGTATDNQRVYVPIMNNHHLTYTLQPSGQQWNGGSWAALNPSTGAILWQTAVPGSDPHLAGYPAGTYAPVSVANGVVYGGSMAGYMVALEASTGRILWQFQSGGAVVSAPSIVNGVVYWGSGYGRDAKGLGGQTNNKLYAFSVN